jgi:hypothetical protein
VYLSFLVLFPFRFSLDLKKKETLSRSRGLDPWGRLWGYSLNRGGGAVGVHYSDLSNIERE